MSNRVQTSTAIRNAISLVGNDTAVKTGLLTSARVGTSVLDLIGVYFLGSFSSAALNDEGTSAFALPLLPNFQLSPLLSLSIALIALTLKSGSSYLLQLLLVRNLNRRCSEIINEVSLKLEYAEKEDIDSLPSQALHYNSTAAIRAATVGILIPASTLFSEGILLLLFGFFLFSTNVLAATVSTLFLGVTSYQLHRILSKRQYVLGQRAGSAGISSLAIFQEMLFGYRELFVRGNLTTSISNFTAIETEISNIQTKQIALSTLPRHVLESTVMLILGLIATISIVYQDIQSAIVLLTIFGAATARILPSLIPLQASLAEIQTNLGKAHSIRFIETSDNKIHHQFVPTQQQAQRTSDEVRLTFNQVYYRYPDVDKWALESITFDFRGFGWFAIDGASGSGKSTIFDLLMGVRTPTHGEILLNNRNPWRFIKDNPGYCSYLPQKISVSNRSVAENIAYGTPLDQIDLEKVRNLLSMVQLDSLIGRSSKELFEPIGELGNKISGGQLQRLGIARCLYTNPKVILLDESTSGLDDASKSSVLDLIEQLSTQLMIISISHDMRITQRAAVVLKIRDGKVV